VTVLDVLVLGGMGEDGLEGRGGDRLRGRGGMDEGELGAGGGRDLPGCEGGKGDDGEIELLDAGMGSDAQVGPRCGIWVSRLDDDVEGRTGVERVSELEYDSIVGRGGDWEEPFAELWVTNVVVEEAL
jgi:hypothetical protein